MTEFSFIHVVGIFASIPPQTHVLGNPCGDDTCRTPSLIYTLTDVRGKLGVVSFTTHFFQTTKKRKESRESVLYPLSVVAGYHLFQCVAFIALLHRNYFGLNKCVVKICYHEIPSQQQMASHLNYSIPVYDDGSCSVFTFPQRPDIQRWFTCITTDAEKRSAQYGQHSEGSPIFQSE